MLKMILKRMRNHFMKEVKKQGGNNFCNVRLDTKTGEVYKDGARLVHFDNHTKKATWDTVLHDEKHEVVGVKQVITGRVINPLWLPLGKVKENPEDWSNEEIERFESIHQSEEDIQAEYDAFIAGGG